MAIADNSKEREKLADEIARIEDSVMTTVTRPTLPEVKLEEMKYTPLSDAYLREQARDSLAQQKNSEYAAINSKSAEEEKALHKKRSDYASALAGELGSIAEAYDAAAQRIDDDVIKRGIARSSIAAVEKGELEQSRARSAASANEAYGMKIADIDAEIANIKVKLNDALNDFNLRYAAKLNDKLESLRSERDAKVAETLKYNNDIKVKQAALDREKLKAESDLYTEALAQRKQEKSLDSLSVDERNKLYAEVYRRMDSFLSTLSPEQARIEIRNHALYRDHLSDYYYYRLYDKYGR